MPPGHFDPRSLGSPDKGSTEGSRLPGVPPAAARGEPRSPGSARVLPSNFSNNNKKRPIRVKTKNVGVWSPLPLQRERASPGAGDRNLEGCKNSLCFLRPPPKHPVGTRDIPPRLPTSPPPAGQGSRDPTSYRKGSSSFELQLFAPPICRWRRKRSIPRVGCC